MSDAVLAHHVRIFAELKERLQAEFGLESDEQVLLDTLDGETELTDRLVAMLRRAKEREAFAKALGEMMKDSGERKKRLEGGAEKLRGVVAWAMQEAGMKKIEAPDLSASLSHGRPKLLVIDEQEAINNGWFKQQDPEVDRARLKGALESGLTCSYASLESNVPPILSVRTK